MFDLWRQVHDPRTVRALPGSRRVTLEEVARVAGVSRATVSRVVNGVASVDQNIRQVVERAITTTGYQPNLAARSLVTRRPTRSSWCCPRRTRCSATRSSARVVTGVMSVLAPTDVHLVLVKLGPGTRDRGDRRSARRGGWTGAIIVPHRPERPAARQAHRRPAPGRALGTPGPADVDQLRRRAPERRRRAGRTAPRHVGAQADRHHHGSAGHAPRARIGSAASARPCPKLGHHDVAWTEGDFSRESGAGGDGAADRRAPGRRRRVRRIRPDGPGSPPGTAQTAPHRPRRHRDRGASTTAVPRWTAIRSSPRCGSRWRT